MFAKLIAAFTGAPVEQIGEYFREKQKLKQELRLEKIRGQTTIAAAEAAAAARKAELVNTWELAQIQNSGFKDEWVLGLISYPMIGAFVPIPAVQESVRQGFIIIGGMPLWYVSLVVAVFLAIYGIRWKGASNIQIGGAP